MIQSRATTRATKSCSVAQATDRPTLTALELDAHVGQRIRRRREALGVTQSRLARYLGVTFSQVQKYEKGANRIGAGRLFLVAAFLGVPVSYFFEERRDSPASSGPPVETGAQLATLEEAFLSIADPETRGSVVALVRSLAASADRADNPTQSVA